ETSSKSSHGDLPFDFSADGKSTAVKECARRGSSGFPSSGHFEAPEKMARPGQSGEKVLVGGARDCGGPRGSVELPQDVRDMPVNGVLADEDALGDRLIRQTERDEAEHFPFAPRQRRRLFSSSTGRGTCGRLPAGARPG